MAELSFHPSSSYVVCELGSNSFNLLHAELSSQALSVKHQLRQVVYLLDGSEDDAIGPEALERATHALLDFSLWLKHARLSCHRVVATSAIRQAPNKALVARLVRRYLQAPLEILSGLDEANLIYQGVWAELQAQASSGPHLVIDVGGGSTELIWGYQGCIEQQLSIELGSLRLGVLEASVRPSEGYYQALLEQSHCALKSLNLQPYNGRVYVSDGLPKYFMKIFKHAPLKELNREMLQELRCCLSSKSANDLYHQYQIQPEVGRLLLGGLAIFDALMSLMALTKLELCRSSLKQGVLAEWVNDCLVLN